MCLLMTEKQSKKRLDLVSLQREPPTTSDHADSIMSRTSKALTAQKTVHGTRHPNAESIPYLLALKQLFKNYQFFPVISMHIQCVYCLLLYATFITVLCITPYLSSRALLHVGEVTLPLLPVTI